MNMVPEMGFISDFSAAVDMAQNGTSGTTQRRNRRLRQVSQRNDGPNSLCNLVWKSLSSEEQPLVQSLSRFSALEAGECCRDVVQQLTAMSQETFEVGRNRVWELLGDKKWESKVAETEMCTRLPQRCWSRVTAVHQSSAALELYHRLVAAMATAP